MPRKTDYIPAEHVLLRLAHGWTLAMMGADFGLTVGQMRHQTRRLYRQLGVSDPAHAVQVAHNKEIISACPEKCGFCRRGTTRKAVPACMEEEL